MAFWCRSHGIVKQRLEVNEEQKRLDEAYARFKQLHEEVQSLMLGTVGGKGLPRVSYAPYVRDGSGNLFVYLSHLSEHTSEMIASKVASVLLIEDESGVEQIFARVRISYLCDVVEIDRDDALYESTLARFKDRFGNVINVLRSLPDFVLFQLSPRSGRFVTGFGQAYNLSGDHLDQLAHIGPDQIKGTDF